MEAVLQALTVDPYDRELWALYLQASAASSRRALEQAWKEARSVLLDDSRELSEIVNGLRLRRYR